MSAKFTFKAPCLLMKVCLPPNLSFGKMSHETKPREVKALGPAIFLLRTKDQANASMICAASLTG